ncbi:MAG: teichoic acid biosynthesis protein [Proteobacteria bacterium]|nr:teichoic acid biosynthesis protein [Pseudomonadota bacterium]
MKILYGIVGEGMGHATRSRVVVEHLLERGHELRIVVSGRAHSFLKDRLEGRLSLTIHEIEGLHLEMDEGGIDLLETVLSNLELAPMRLRHNLGVYREVAEDDFKPDLVVSDFESWAYLYARNHRIPVISIDNMQVLNRCSHTGVIEKGNLDFQVAKWSVRAKVPGAYHYLITSFFYPTITKKRTTFIPPILRPEILVAERKPGDHVLVYQTRAGSEALLPVLKTLPYEFYVYGLGREGTEDNVTLKGFSETGFINDLATAKAVVANAGFSLMGEAVHLHVPMLALPLDGQFEQELNARYLGALGYGSWTPKADADVLTRFIERTEQHEEALQAYESVDNSMTLACVDELIDCAVADVDRPNLLQSKNRGGWVRRRDRD